MLASLVKPPGIRKPVQLRVEWLEERLALTLPPEVIDLNSQIHVPTSFPFAEYQGNLIYVSDQDLWMTQGAGVDGIRLTTAGRITNPSKLTMVGNWLEENTSGMGMSVVASSAELLRAYTFIRTVMS